MINGNIGIKDLLSKTSYLLVFHNTVCTVVHLNHGHKTSNQPQDYISWEHTTLKFGEHGCLKCSQIKKHVCAQTVLKLFSLRKSCNLLFFSFWLLVGSVWEIRHITHHVPTTDNVSCSVPKQYPSLIPCHGEAKTKLIQYFVKLWRVKVRLKLV